MPNYLIVLTKQPRAGRSKTRIGRALGDVVALRLAEAFVLDTLELARGHGARTMIAYAPRSARGWFAERAPGALLHEQPPGNLGHRMHAAMEAAFGAGAAHCVLIGMDTPHIEPHRIDEAFSALVRHDACIGPAEDGGYYLVGLSRPAAHLFEDVPWSTPDVLAVTRERAREAGLELADLPREFDVDEASDLPRLREALVTRPHVAGHTRACLRSLDQ